MRNNSVKTRRELYIKGFGSIPITCVVNIVSFVNIICWNPDNRGIVQLLLPLFSPLFLLSQPSL
jgi:hypothetical protein